MDSKADMFDFDTLVETYDVEAKKAGGRDGCGELPDSVWETYSAMANTEGGTIILGAKQVSATSFEPYPIKNAEKVLRDFWSALNNSNKVSKNILQNKDVTVSDEFGDGKVIFIHVPQASRKDRPIYINGNPLGGTYRRFDEGDCCCPDDVVRQMLAEQGSETMDDVIIRGYGLEDLDTGTFNAYRQRLSNRQPDHPFNNLDSHEFLRSIGGYRTDRITGVSGLTLAGLLMFGKLRDILDNVPNYVVDYQERPRAVTELRWIDRITTDFTWAGNLFSFYLLVIPKLFSGLKTHFELENSTVRVEDTPVHKAIREALINTIIHADYNGKSSILVVKRPDLFGFRNPGTFRLPREEVLRGGSSDCRNRTLQKMFQLLGLAEQAGSGIPKIYYGWDWQDWKRPELEEKIDVNQTVLALRMSSLYPDEAVAAAQKSVGNRYKNLTKLERLALVTAFAEGCVNHDRLTALTKDHRTDISSALHKLVQKNMLVVQGKGRATIYYPTGHVPIEGDISRCEAVIDTNHEVNDGTSNSHHNASNSHHNASNSHHNVPEPESYITCDEELLKISAEVRKSKRATPEKIQATILELCMGRYLSVAEIATLVNRGKVTIGNNYLVQLCKDGKLEPQFKVKNHPAQKYTTVQKNGNSPVYPSCSEDKK
ncbi:MAG: putative DNA binding domain-containing protein [Lentisphaeria bacterium]|nr:putative DNA binding domain-containing protein [Lentisphaeria bacterium]